MYCHEPLIKFVCCKWVQIYEVSLCTGSACGDCYSALVRHKEETKGTSFHITCEGSAHNPQPPPPPTPPPQKKNAESCHPFCILRILQNIPANGANVCFLSTLPLLPATTAVFSSYLSSLYPKHCIAGASLPIHMIGEVSWEPKIEEARGPLSTNSSMILAQRMLSRTYTIGNKKYWGRLMKRTVSRDFLLQVFFIIDLALSP